MSAITYRSIERSRALFRTGVEARTVLLIGLFAAHVIMAVSRPYGAYDAGAMWNLKASYVYHFDALTAFQVPFIGHQEYPPLLPMIIGIGYRVAGFIPAVQIAIHALIYAALLWTFRRAPLWAFVIVATGTLEYSTWQYADLLIAVCFVAAWEWYQRAGDNPGTGALIGIALMSKNEGAMLAVVMLAVLVVKNRRIPWRTLAGAAPGAVALVLFKLFVVVEPNDLIGSVGIVERLIDPTRYVQIIEYCAALLWRWQYSTIPILLIVWGMNSRRAATAPLLFVVVAAVGFVLIYALTPHDLAWHLGTSADRLVLQLFPTLVLALAYHPKTQSDKRAA